MIIKIKSDNPNLSYVLRKNPANPLTIYKYRSGFIIAHYVNNNEFIINFESSPNKFWGDTCYLDSNDYTNPIAYLGCMREVINDVLVKDCEQDIISSNSITLSYLKVQPNSICILSSLFPNIKITLEEHVIISNIDKVQDLIIYTFLLLVLNIPSKEFLYSLGDSFFNKIVTVLEKLNKPIPYMVVYKITTKLLPRDKFSSYKKRLENLLNVAYCDLDYRYLQEARKTTIKQVINRENVCIDLGAGEGQYSFLQDIVKDYIAVDRDGLCREKLISKGLKVYSNITDIQIVEPTTILVTEVIEHNTYKEAIHLLVYLSSIKEINQIIITVPNREFNKYFDMAEGDFRHYDHKWEPNYREFVDLINSAFSSWSKQFLDIGTNINYVTPTIGVELTRND